MYIITIYKELYDAAIVGFNITNCQSTIINPQRATDMARESNIGEAGKFIWEINALECDSEKYFPKVTEFLGYKYLSRGSSNVDKIRLSKQMPLFSGYHDTFYLGTDGYLSLENLNNSRFSWIIKPQNMVYNKIYFANVNFNTGQDGRGNISYLEITDTSSKVIQLANSQMKFFLGRDFNTNHVFMVDYDNMLEDGSNSKPKSFQVALVSNGMEAYIIIQYHTYLGYGTKNAYESKNCNWDANRLDVFFSSTTGNQNRVLSNTGRSGQYIFKVYDQTCMHKAFIPYGSSNGDTILSKFDDAERHIELKKTMPLFTKLSRFLYLSPNGRLSLLRASQYETELMTKDSVAFSTLYSDFESDSIGNIYYRETFDQSDLDLINKALNQTGFRMNHAFVVTFINVRDAVDDIFSRGYKNSFQMILASDGETAFGISIYYRVDSERWAEAGYSDNTCEKNVYFHIPSYEDLRRSNFQEMTKIHQLTDHGCKKRNNYFPFDETRTDAFVPYNSSDSFIEIQLKFPMLLGQENVTKIYVSKYGFVSLNKKPKEDIVWFPYNHSSIVYGYVTDLPGNVYIQQSKDQTLLSNATKLLLRTKDQISKEKPLTDLVMITWFTPERDGKNPAHLKANDFQIVFAYNEDATWLFLLYQRLDSIIGQIGINVPRCYVAQPYKHIESRYIFAKSELTKQWPNVPPGVYVYELSKIFGQCFNGRSKANTNFVANGLPHGDSFLGYLDFIEDYAARSQIFQLQKPMIFFGNRTATRLKIFPDGFIVINNDKDSMLDLDEDLKKMDVVVAYASPYHTNRNGEDALYIREIFDEKQTFDHTDHAITKYLELNAQYGISQPAYSSNNAQYGINQSDSMHSGFGARCKTNHAVVSTFNTLYNAHFQVIFASCENLNNDTFLVINFGDLPRFSRFMHGVSNPGCRWQQINKISLIQTESYEFQSNIGVPGQFVYPITNRECKSPFTSSSTTTTTTGPSSTIVSTPKTTLPKITPPPRTTGAKPISEKKTISLKPSTNHPLQTTTHRPIPTKSPETALQTTKYYSKSTQSFQHTTFKHIQTTPEKQNCKLVINSTNCQPISAAHKDMVSNMVAITALGICLVSWKLL
uniref:NIDO domain-containing protein n=2 Tax=Clytia hemisphaerica TaxID=252671 RepID=A0A7M5XEQ7_9CNID